MMNYCPKCRGFYDDQLLRFCIKDGTPLVSVNSDELWNEGTTALRESAKIARRAATRQILRKVISTLVTTIVTILVIYVIVMNAWIYSGGPERYFPPSQPPTPTPAATPTGTPTPTPIGKIERKSPTPTPTPIAVACNLQRESEEIRRSYASYFLTQIRAMQSSLGRQYLTRERQAVLVGVTLNNFTPSVSSDCRTATVVHPFQALIFNRDGTKAPPINLSRTFSCMKSGTWRCG